MDRGEAAPPKHWPAKQLLDGGARRLERPSRRLGDRETGPRAAGRVSVQRLAGKGSGESAAGSLLELDPLFRFLLPDEEYARFKANHLESLQGALVWVYGGGAVGWPPAWLSAEAQETEKAIGDGVRAFTEY